MAAWQNNIDNKREQDARLSEIANAMSAIGALSKADPTTAIGYILGRTARGIWDNYNERGDRKKEINWGEQTEEPAATLPNNAPILNGVGYGQLQTPFNIGQPPTYSFNPSQYDIRNALNNLQKGNNPPQGNNGMSWAGFENIPISNLTNNANQTPVLTTQDRGFLPSNFNLTSDDVYNAVLQSTNSEKEARRRAQIYQNKRNSYNEGQLNGIMQNSTDGYLTPEARATISRIAEETPELAKRLEARYLTEKDKSIADITNKLYQQKRQDAFDDWKQRFEIQEQAKIDAENRALATREYLANTYGMGVPRMGGGGRGAGGGGGGGYYRGASRMTGGGEGGSGDYSNGQRITPFLDKGERAELKELYGLHETWLMNNPEAAPDDSPYAKRIASLNEKQMNGGQMQYFVDPRDASTIKNAAAQFFNNVPRGGDTPYNLYQALKEHGYAEDAIDDFLNQVYGEGTVEAIRGIPGSSEAAVIEDVPPPSTTSPRRRDKSDRIQIVQFAKNGIRPEPGVLERVLGEYNYMD